MDEIIVNLVDNETLEEEVMIMSKRKKFQKQSKLNKWNQKCREK